MQRGGVVPWQGGAAFRFPTGDGEPHGGLRLRFFFFFFSLRFFFGSLALVAKILDLDLFRN